MADRLKDKIAIVTGAGASGPGWGNGKATAVLFAREGAKVLAADIDRDAAAETAAIIEGEGGTCAVCAVDVADSGAVAAMVAQCLEAYGRIDVLHNNVGIAELGGPEEASEGSWDRVMTVNTKSIFLTAKYVLPHMVAQRAGAVTNVSSVAGARYIGSPYISYPASKGAINQMTRVLAARYGRYNVRINTLVPGIIRTPMGEALVESMIADSDEFETIDDYVAARSGGIPLGRWGTPWDIANAALFLASDEASYITGTELVVDGGLTQLAGGVAAPALDD